MQLFFIYCLNINHVLHYNVPWKLDKYFTNFMIILEQLIVNKLWCESTYNKPHLPCSASRHRAVSRN